MTVATFITLNHGLAGLAVWLRDVDHCCWHTFEPLEDGDRMMLDHGLRLSPGQRVGFSRALTGRGEARQAVWRASDWLMGRLVGGQDLARAVVRDRLKHTALAQVRSDVETWCQPDPLRRGTWPPPEPLLDALAKLVNFPGFPFPGEPLRADVLFPLLDSGRAHAEESSP